MTLEKLKPWEWGIIAVVVIAVVYITETQIPWYAWLTLAVAPLLAFFFL